MARYPAEAVGDGFAKSYYSKLQNSPELLTRFYKDVSKISRPGLDGIMRASTLPDMIEHLDMLSSGGFDSVEVTSIISHDSHSGGIFIVADGYFISYERPARNFTQSFFLAPQESGYFVCTDIFKFVDISKANATIPPAHEGAAICVKNLPPDATISLVEDEFEQFGEIRRGGIEVRNKRSFSYGFVEFKEKNAAQKAIEASPVMFDLRSVYVEKKRPDYISYWETPSCGPGNVHSNVEMRVTKAPGNNDESLSVSEPKDDTGNENNQESQARFEGSASAVHVRNLPPKATTDWVVNAFKRFGPIKRGGIQVLNPGLDYWYGFVKFEEADAAERAIKASPIWIGRRKLIVQKELGRRVHNQN